MEKNLSPEQHAFVRSVQKTDVRNVDDLVRKTNGGHIGREELNQFFEELYGKSLKFDRADLSIAGHMRYADPKTEVIWQAFRVAFKGQQLKFHHSIRRMRRDQVQGPFVIGSEVADGTVEFSKRPFKHGSVGAAVRQAKQLVQRYKKSFVVFGAIDKVRCDEQPFPQPVESTKQGVSGKPRSQAVTAMDEVATYLRDSAKQNRHLATYPGAINFSALGKITVDMLSRPSKGEEIIETVQIFDSFQDAVNMLQNWLKKQKELDNVRN